MANNRTFRRYKSSIRLITHAHKNAFRLLKFWNSSLHPSNRERLPKTIHETAQRTISLVRKILK